MAANVAIGLMVLIVGVVILAANGPLSEYFRDRSGLGAGRFAKVWSRGIVAVVGIAFIAGGIAGVVANV